MIPFKKEENDKKSSKFPNFSIKEFKMNELEISFMDKNRIDKEYLNFLESQIKYDKNSYDIVYYIYF